MKFDHKLPAATLCGLPIKHFLELHAVIEKHGIKSAEALDAKLSLDTPKPVPGKNWVAIYDSGNKDRLLGYLMERPSLSGGKKYLRHFAPPMIGSCYATVHDEAALKIDMVMFEFDWRCRVADYEAELVFLTDAKLDQLLRDPAFALPNETRAQVSERQRMQRFN